LLLVAVVALLMLASAYVFMDPIYWGAKNTTGEPVDSWGTFSTPFLISGIDRPAALPQADAKLEDDAPVVGIQAGGQSRAYVLAAFRGPGKHIVNDLLGDVPVSITYCDLCDLVKVFTGESPGVSLRLNQGGRLKGRMLLHFEGSFYFQDTGQPIGPQSPPLPYQPFPFERCSWKEWRTTHPQGDVYVGVVGTGLIQ
jgi:hypothetical protein